MFEFKKIKELLKTSGLGILRDLFIEVDSLEPLISGDIRAYFLWHRRPLVYINIQLAPLPSYYFLHRSSAVDFDETFMNWPCKICNPPRDSALHFVLDVHLTSETPHLYL